MPATTSRLAAVRRAAWRRLRGGPTVNGPSPCGRPCCCDSRIATWKLPPPKAMLQAAFCTGSARPASAARPIDLEAAELQHRLGDRAHRHLPRIEVGALAAHRHQHDAREAAVLQDQRSVLMQLPTPLDCISSAARSPPSAGAEHERRPSASEVSTTSRDLLVGLAEIDQPRMAGVRHVADLPDARGASTPHGCGPASRPASRMDVLLNVPLEPSLPSTPLVTAASSRRP